MILGAVPNAWVAYVAGFLTFFASCLSPLTPGYIAYLAGLTGEQMKDVSQLRKKRWNLVTHALWFVLGFVGVFMVMGFSASTIGNLLGVYRTELQKVGGIFLIVVGLFMLNLIKIPVLYSNVGFRLPTLRKARLVGSFLTGLTFGLAWTPCIGPVLAVILFWASRVETSSQGTWLLLLFGLGLGTPYLILALLFDTLASRIRGLGTLGHFLQVLGGVLVIVMGVLMLTGKSALISIQLIKVLGINALTF